MKAHTQLLQLSPTQIYYVWKYDKLMWVCVTMRESNQLNSNVKLALKKMIIKQIDIKIEKSLGKLLNRWQEMEGE